MTIIATAPVPAHSRLDAATTATDLGALVGERWQVAKRITDLKTTGAAPADIAATLNTDKPTLLGWIARFVKAETGIDLTAPVAHPAWCTGRASDCLMDDGALFHRIEFAEIDCTAVDQLAGGTITIVIEQLNNRPPQIRVEGSPELTPAQALQLAGALSRAADLIARR